jgi:hypothetical protein
MKRYIVIKSDHYEPGFSVIGKFNTENETKKYVKDVCQDEWGCPIYESLDLITLKRNVIYQIKG